MAEHTDPQTLTDWVDRLNELRMPVFARTAADISKVISDKTSSAAALANIILKDASMAARVLRVANSSFHRGSGTAICTVSRAIVKLGFATIRSITMSVSVVEALLKGEQRDRVSKEMAHAFHAAAQARSLMEQKDPQQAEEAFVAALLYRIGNMAFWCLPPEMTDRLEQAIAQAPDTDPATTEKQVLGFTMHELTTALSERWELGEPLKQVLTHPDPEDPLVASITLGHRLADATEQGWDSEALGETLETAAKQLGLPAQTLRRLSEDSAGIAAEQAEVYGAPQVAALIRAPKAAGAETDLAPEAEAVPPTPEPAPTYIEPDPKLQLAFLRELATVVEEKAGINELLSMILEGIHRGIGMDRALLALLSSDRRVLKGKYALGTDHEQLLAQFQFDMKPPPGEEHVFSQQVKIGQALLIPPDPPQKLLRLLPEHILTVTGRNGFFSAPILVDRKAIGLIYADRLPSGRELDEESYDSFRHFVQQASLGLAEIGRRS